MAFIPSILGLWAGKANQAISVDKYPLLVSLRNVKDVPFYQNTIFIVALIILVLIGIFILVLRHRARMLDPCDGLQSQHVAGPGDQYQFQQDPGPDALQRHRGFASGLYAQYQGFADVNMGRGAIVIGLAAVIIGQVVFGKISGNFAFKLLSVALGAILYYLVLQVVLWLGLNPMI